MMVRTGLLPYSCAVIGLVAALGGCKPQQGMPVAGVPEVVVQTVVPKDVPVDASYSGQTTGSRVVEVRPRVTGILLRRNYQEGSAVSEGQQLYQIDPAEFKAALDQAEAQYAQQKAQVDKTRRDLARLEPLLQDKAVARKDVDDARSALEQAEAALQASEASVVKARLNMDYTKVYAPTSGIASLSLLSEGSLANGAQSLLTTIVKIDPIYVMFSLPENERLMIQRMRASGRLSEPSLDSIDVQLTLSDGTQHKVTGKINFADTLFSSTTGTLQLRAELPNPKAKLLPGQFVKVTIKGFVMKDAIVIPQKAVATSAKGQSVYVIDKDGVARARAVETGGTLGEGVFVGKGLQAGDQVVVEGLAKVRTDKPVKIVSAAASAPAGE